ncbi:MAG: sodium:calcium antiporter [Myxococcales bacterium]|nr:sodium:calcium antiporter [Myxococcales bacterium]
MTVIIALGAVILGFTLLVGGGDLLVRGAEKLAVKLRLTPVVIGLTVVAFGTSVPELVVSLLAAFEGNPDIAAGNVIGSNILNIAAVMGGTAIVMPIAINQDITRIHWPFMFALSIIFVTMVWDTQLVRTEGVILFALLVTFTGWMIDQTRRKSKQAQEDIFDHASGEVSPESESTLKPFVLIFLGIGLLWAGGKFALWGAVELSRLWGLTERVIALTVVAFGTSLPELVASLVAAFRNQEDMAVGNIIGSNIYNIGCVLGLTSMIKPIGVDPQLVQNDAMMMLGVAFVLFPMGVIFKGLPRWSGVVYLASLGGYTTWLLQPGAFG